MADTQGLAASIDSLGQTKGMGKAEQMAAAMTDQSQRLEASWFAIRAAAFSMVLPAFNAVTGSIADGLMWLTSMTSEYPVLTEVLSYAAIGALSLGGVVASLARDGNSQNDGRWLGSDHSGTERSIQSAAH